MKYLFLVLFLALISLPQATNAQIHVDRDECAQAEQLTPDQYRLHDLNIGCLSIGSHLSTSPFKHPLASDPLRSIETYNWTTEWEKAALRELYYNAEGQQSNTFSSAWDSTLNAYKVVAQTTRAFNADSLVAVSTDLIYDAAADTFIYSRQTLIEWEGEQPLSSRAFIWDSTEWRPTLATINTVENGLVTVSVFQTYDGNLGMLVNRSQNFNEYDEMGRHMFTRTERWNSDLGAWVTTSRNSTTYEERTTTNTRESYNSADSTWSIIQRITTTFNEQMQPLALTDTPFAAGQPAASLKMTWTYDESGFLIEAALLTELSPPNNAFQNVTRTLYTNDEDGDILETIAQIYQEGAWVNTRRSVYTYLPALVSNKDERALSTATLEVYPSPSRGSVNLDIQLDQPSALQVDVYDILGRRVTTLANTSMATGAQHLVWEPQDAAAGLYFVRVQLDESVETRAFTLIR